MQNFDFFAVKEGKDRIIQSIFFRSTSVDAARSDESQKQHMEPCYLVNRVKSRIPVTEIATTVQAKQTIPVGAKKRGEICEERSRRGSIGGTGSSGAHLGDVLDLGEPEGHPEAAEEHGDEGAGVAEGRDAELPAVGLHPARQLLERLRHRR
jgi:hypothetical protein